MFKATPVYASPFLRCVEPSGSGSPAFPYTVASRVNSEASVIKPVPVKHPAVIDEYPPGKHRRCGDGRSCFGGGPKAGLLRPASVILPDRQPSAAFEYAKEGTGMRKRHRSGGHGMLTVLLDV